MVPPIPHGVCFRTVRKRNRYPIQAMSGHNHPCPLLHPISAPVSRQGFRLKRTTTTSYVSSMIQGGNAFASRMTFMPLPALDAPVGSWCLEKHRSSPLGAYNRLGRVAPLGPPSSSPAPPSTSSCLALVLASKFVLPFLLFFFSCRRTTTQHFSCKRKKGLPHRAYYKIERGDKFHTADRRPIHSRSWIIRRSYSTYIIKERS